MTDAAYGLALLNGTFHHQLVYDAGWIGYYLLWGSVALDPTMRTLTEPSPDRQRSLTGRRLALLTIASVLAPSIEIVREFGNGDVDLLVIVAASIVLFLLVILRVVGLARQHERAVSRERALGIGAATLASAVDESDIRAATRDTAIALIAGAGEVRLCREVGESLVVRDALDVDTSLSARATREIEDAAESLQGGPLGAGTRAQLGVSELAAWGTPFPVIVPGRRGLIVIASEAPLSPLIVQALRTLRDSVSARARQRRRHRARPPP